MTRIDATKVKWKVEIRLTPGGKWQSMGVFETRRNAREAARWQRLGLGNQAARGYGNTRVVRRERAQDVAK